MFSAPANAPSFSDFPWSSPIIPFSLVSVTCQGVNISSQGETIDEVRLEQNESAVRFVSYKIVSINLPVLKEARVFPLCEPVCSPFHVSPLSNMWRSK